MKILVIGGSGVIGLKFLNFFLRNGEDVSFTYNKNKIPLSNSFHLDITEKEYTLDLIKEVNPEVIIHATAVTNVDLCETNHDLATSVNVDGTSNIVEGAKITNSKIVYLSTPFVFDGKKSGYTEEDKTSPSTFYGLTKFEGEQIVIKSEIPYLILRIDQPYCWIEEWQHANSVLRVIQTLKAGKILREIQNWKNNPTYVPDLVRATYELLIKNASGIFHLVGSDFINRYDWSLKVAQEFDLDKKLIIPINSDELNLSTKRVNVKLYNKKLYQKTGIQMLGIKEGLHEMKKIQYQ